MRAALAPQEAVAAQERGRAREVEPALAELEAELEARATLDVPR